MGDLKAINPIRPEAFWKTYIWQTKNDLKDSFIIARSCGSASSQLPDFLKKPSWLCVRFRVTGLS